MSRRADLTMLAEDLRVACVLGARRIRVEPSSPVPPHHLTVLMSLYRHGPQCPTALAEHDHVTTPSMTRTLASLVDAGLVTRTPHPTDGRRQIVAITDAGRRVVDESMQGDKDWILNHLESLDDVSIEGLRDAVQLLLDLANSPA